MKNVPLLNKVVYFGLLLLGTYLCSKLLQVITLYFLDQPFFVNPLSITQSDEFTSSIKVSLILLDFISFALCYFVLKKCLSFLEKTEKK